MNEDVQRAFREMLKAARDEADSKGTYSIESVAKDMDRIIARAAAAANGPSFSRIWNNPEDDV
jgi:hypothetical protein